ncbi:hypothetical protein J2T59_001287 [Methanosalsum natronophilum]|nr:hypothetical protein [Methanosalsum natronophilum]
MSFRKNELFSSFEGSSVQPCTVHYVYHLIKTTQ